MENGQRGRVARAPKEPRRMITRRTRDRSIFAANGRNTLRPYRLVKEATLDVRIRVLKLEFEEADLELRATEEPLSAPCSESMLSGVRKKAIDLPNDKMEEHEPRARCPLPVKRPCRFAGVRFRIFEPLRSAVSAGFSQRPPRLGVTFSFIRKNYQATSFRALYRVQWTLHVNGV